MPSDVEEPGPEGVAVLPLHGLGRAPVEATALGRRKPGLDGVAHQCMHEPVLSGRLAELDEPCTDGFHGQIEPCGLRHARHRCDRGHVEITTQDGGGPQEGDTAVGKPLQPVRDGGSNGGGHGDEAAARPCVGHGPSHFPDEQRVAPGERLDAGHRPCVHVLAEHHRQLPTDRCGRKSLQIEHSGQRLARQAAEDLGVPLLPGTRAGHDQQPVIAQRPCKVVQEEQCRGVRPVDVVEHEDQRATAAYLAQQAGYGIELAEPVVGGRRGPIVVFLCREDVGSEPCQLCVDPQISGEPHDVLVDRDRAEDLPPLPVRRCAEGVAGQPPGAKCAPRRRDLHELIHESRLADARLALAQDHVRAAGERIFEALDEHRQLGVTPHQFRPHDESPPQSPCYLQFTTGGRTSGCREK